MPPIGLILLVAVAVSLCGIVVLILAARGRAVPGSLVCSACCFDVLGIPDESVCPECGRALGVPGAARPRRSRSGFALITGVLLTLLPAFAIGGIVYANTSSANLYQYAPAWLLMIEAEKGTPTRAAAALNELAMRMGRGSLPEPALRTLVGTAMRLRTTPNITWNAGWSDIIEQARSEGRITDAQWTEYVRHSIAPVCRHRRAIRRGAELPISLSIAGTQLASNPGGSVVVRYGIERMVLADHVVFADGAAQAQATVRRIGTSSGGQFVRVSLPEGEYKSVAKYRFEVLDPLDTNRVLGSWTQDFDSILEIAAPETAVVAGISDQSFGDMIRKSLTISSLRMGTDGYLVAMLNFREAPAPLAFEVFARLNDGSEAGKRLSLGTVYFSKGDRSGVVAGAGALAKSSDATHADLILTPSITAAEQTVDMDFVWMGPDILIPDVPIRKAGRR